MSKPAGTHFVQVAIGPEGRICAVDDVGVAWKLLYSDGSPNGPPDRWEELPPHPGAES